MSGKPRQIEIKDEDKRLVSGWASVSVLDKEGDIVPVSELKRSMLTLMDRGGHIIYGHSNKPVGKILQWEVKEHPDTKALGIHFIAKIFSDYPVDDIVWEKIKKGELTGFSIGATAREEKKVLKDDSTGLPKEVGILRDLSLMEVSVVEEPANPLALVDEVNYVAKGDAAMNELESEAEKIPEKRAEELEDASTPDDFEKAVELLDVHKDRSKWINPDGTFKNGFEGCVEWAMAPKSEGGYGLDSEERARALCAYIGRKAGKIKGYVDESEVEEALKELEVHKDRSRWINPDGSFKGGFEGCVRWAMASPKVGGKGLSEERARKLCAYIGRKAGKIPGDKGSEAESISSEVRKLASDVRKQFEKTANYVKFLKSRIDLKKALRDVRKPFGKWQSFDDCVRDMKSQGYNDESAKRICGSLQAKLGESE